MNLRDSYKAKIEAQIEEETARIAMLKARAKRLAADAQILSMEELAETEAKLEALKAKLGRYLGAGEGAFEDLKHGVGLASRNLAQAVRHAAKRFE